jgi:opacity protein-like surface antigen
MGWLKTFIVGGAVLAGSISLAHAADVPGTMPPPPYMMPRAEPRPAFIDLRSGWYVRGDLGYGDAHYDGAVSSTPALSPATTKAGSGFIGGVGAGFKSKWLRTDVTLDYLGPLKYEGRVAAPGDVTAKMSAWTALVNGYFDLGTWYRMTPYIGAGVGAARVRVADYNSLVAPPFAAGLSNSQWNFAWAAMAGIGYAVSPNIVIDAGYRYLNLGDSKSAADSSGYMTFKNLAAHEVRVGIRWNFNDLPVSR